MELADESGTSIQRLDKYYSWRGSSAFGGTPGTASANQVGVRINEVLAHTDAPQVDSIELHNTTGASIDISGWYLSDSGNNPLKYQVAAGTEIPAWGYVVFDESHFNPTPLAPGPNDFALSGSGGDSVWLVIPDASGLAVDSVVDVVDFGATFNGVTLGRLPDGSGRLEPLQQPSLGSANGPHAVGELAVTEINYHPADPTPAALLLDPTIDANDLEFVEVHNSSLSTVDLTNWRLRGNSDSENSQSAFWFSVVRGLDSIAIKRVVAI